MLLGKRAFQLTAPMGAPISTTDEKRYGLDTAGGRICGAFSTAKPGGENVWAQRI